MLYGTCAPARDLQPFVRCYWWVTDEGGPGAPADTVVPDGCAELIINAGDAMEQLDGADHREQPRAMIVAEVRRPVQVRPTGRVELFGVRLTPVGMRSLLRVPAHEIVDRTLDLADVADHGLRAGLCRLPELAAHDRPGYANEVLRASMGSHRDLDALVWRLTAAMEALEGRCTVTELSAKAGISARHLERRFRTQVGVPPQALLAVLRFRRVLASLDAQMPAWAHVAAACGYHDQSHLIRDFKRYTGMSPRAFLGDKNPFGELFLPAGR